MGLGEHLGPQPTPPKGGLGSGNADGSRAGGGRELTTVTMGGVRAQADVAGHQKAGERLAQQADGLDSRGVLGVGCRTPLILAVAGGHREHVLREAPKNQDGQTSQGEAPCMGMQAGQSPFCTDLPSQGVKALLISFLSLRGCCHGGGVPPLPPPEQPKAITRT